MTNKVVYPIAKKRVIGATKISDDTYDSAVRFLNEKRQVNLYSWSLTIDDYLIGIDRYTNTLLAPVADYDYFLFFCY